MQKFFDGGPFPAPSHEEIVSRLKIVETRGSTGVTCVLGGTPFTSEGDLRGYIMAHAIPSCALYWDLFSIMVCMIAEGLTGKERSDRIYLAERGWTSSALEGKLVASMSHKRQLCLYGDGSRLACLDKGFVMCKTYEQWIGSGNQVSYRQELSNQILVYTDGILDQIGAREMPAHHLAQVLLNPVGMQWNAVVGFIDMFYLELVAKAKFDAQIDLRSSTTTPSQSYSPRGLDKGKSEGRLYVGHFSNASGYSKLH
jgi:hypothetical protein